MQIHPTLTGPFGNLSLTCPIEIIMIGLSFHFCSGGCNLDYGRDPETTCVNHENDVTLLFVCHALSEHESTMSIDLERGFGVCLASTQLYRKMI